MEELHKVLNDQGLTISTLPEKGRCIFTTRDFSPGEVIISQSPFVAVPNVYEESPESKCEWCFSSSNIKACSACHAVWYCSTTCQKSDWKLHRGECKSLSKVEKERLKYLTPMIRLMVKLHTRLKLENEKNFPATATDNSKLLEALGSHMSDVDQKQVVNYTQMAALVNAILQWPASEINIKEIAENFSKLSCNSHTIIDSQLLAIGTGLYPVISLTNHSCVPNSVLLFEGRLAVIRAMEHMPKDTEVLTSYIDTAGSTVTRQKALKEKYFFTCSCPRCIKLGQPDDIRETAILEGYRCKDSCCDGFLLCGSDNKGFVCQKCGLVLNNKELSSITNELKCISDKASVSLSSGRKSEASVAYKRIEKLQLKLYHPFSISIMRTRETILKISMELMDFKGAYSYCISVIQIYERVYPKCHPLLGLHYYLCGQIEMLMGEKKATVESLTKAYNIFRITHGTKTPFTMELKTKLEEARAMASLGRMKIKS
ncbi:hypothetical protein ACP275_03G110200 [Erythranthe tilingii]